MSAHTGHGSPDSPVHPSGTIGRRAHVAAGAFVGQALVDGLVDRGDDRRGAIRARACRSSRTARPWRGGRPRWPACGRARRSDAGRAGSRGCACWSPRTPQPATRAVTSSASGPSRSSGGPSMAVGSDAPHTGSTFGARLGEQQGRTVGEDESGLAVARLGRLLLVDEQSPALHQVDHERHRLELAARGTCPGVRPIRAAGRRRRRVAGTAVFNAVKVNGWNFVSSRAGELRRSAARRALEPRAARARQRLSGTRSARGPR